MKLRLDCTVSPEDDAKTVKCILKSRLGLSERLIKRLKYAGQILCNKIPVHVDVRVKEGDEVVVLIEFDEYNDRIIPEEMDIDIVYEDDCIIAVNKPPDIVVHPTCSHPSGTLANALVYHLMKKGGKSVIRPVNRLDRGTSGIMVFASNQYVQEKLSMQMKNGLYHKEYLGIVHGIVHTGKGRIDLPIGRKPGSIMLRHVSPTGVHSVTNYEVLEHLNGASYLKFELETGRTHQIRVHCQATGHPLVGDTLYPLIPYPEHGRQIKISCESSPEQTLNIFGQISPIIARQALHSCRITLFHPLDGRKLELAAPIPHDFELALEILRK